MGEKELSSSLADLEERLRKARAPSPKLGQKVDETVAPGLNVMGVAFRIAVELVAAVVFGGAVGLLIDHWFNSAPFGLVVMVTLSSIAGFRAVYLSLQRHMDRPGASPEPGGDSGLGSGAGAPADPAAARPTR